MTLRKAAAHAAHVADRTGDRGRIRKSTRRLPADGTEMGHVVMALVAVGSFDHNSRGGSRRTLFRNALAITRLRPAEGLSDLPLAQYSRSTPADPILFALRPVATGYDQRAQPGPTSRRQPEQRPNVWSCRASMQCRTPARTPPSAACSHGRQTRHLAALESLTARAAESSTVGRRLGACWAHLGRRVSRLSAKLTNTLAERSTDT